MDMIKMFFLFIFFMFLALIGEVNAASPTRITDAVVNGQISIGKGTAADSKAVADMVSTTKGLLIPRMTTTQRDAISSPPTGLEIYNTTTNKKNVYNSTSWVEVGSGSGGEKNAITNGAFNDDATGVAAYADAAASSPVDGTAGSPTVTCTRSTGSPILEGAGQLLITKDAANRQGEGCSIAFTLDVGEQGHTQVVRFMYSPASGTYAGGTSSTDSDIKVYIYDVTNSVLIYPSANKIDGAVTDSKYKSALMEWQAPSNSTSYRLIFHVATTSATAYTMKLDEIKVGPMNTAQGPPVTNRTAFTPTGSFDNTVYTGFYSQSADMAEFEVKLALGGPVTPANLTVNLPAGMTIDTAKLTGTTENQSLDMGGSSGFDTGSGNSAILRVEYNNTTSVKVRMADDAANFVQTRLSVDESNPFVWASGDIIFLRFKVPIAGWSSGQTSSAQYSGRKIYAKYQSTSTATNPTIIDYDTKIQDTVSMCVTGGSWKCTVPEPGEYKIKACLQVSPTSGPANFVADDTLALAVYVNNVAKQYGFKRVIATTTVPDQICIEDTQTLAANDYVHIQWTGTTTASNATISGGVTVNYMTIERSAIPEQILATDKVFLTVGKTTGNQSSSGSEQDVASWDAVTLESHGGSFVASTGVWTAPAGGVFDVWIELGFVANATGSRYCRLAKNGSNFKSSAEVLGSASVGAVLFIKEQVRLVAGNTLKVACYQNSGGNLNYNTSTEGNRFIINRIGL